MFVCEEAEVVTLPTNRRPFDDVKRVRGKLYEVVILCLVNLRQYLDLSEFINEYDRN